ncbi:acyl-CoA dehydrogenase family protein [Aquabacterium sp. J223]|uniref:acyl-CoA dehydrogenase family protein n=1 Tax=Aquabacterium sp. J223 TaxID=2898431 RepID=UPI0021ADCDDB|nr:acyl-CoA dehydrogenase family protein [Aquabacterium sp. J223]UUX94078.1 acyl-CoA dehydrogenase family protein [Aquabacterium sp. J223]
MDFDFSDDQEQLRDAVRRWVSQEYGFEQRMAIVKAGGFDRRRYAQLAELGLTALQVPQAHGGLAMGPVEAMVVMEELGRGLVLEPLAATALVAPTVLTQAGDAVQEAWLPRIADGSALVVLAHQERAARYRLDRVEARAEPRNGGWTVSGEKGLVPVGDQADAFIVPAGTAEGLALFLVERQAAGVTARGHALHDGGRAAGVRFDGAAATLLVPGAQGLAVLEQAVDVGIAALAAEAVGAMDALMALTVEYLNTRKQFNVPIASFQALRHRVADCKMQQELARSMSYYATLKLGEPADVRRRALSQAKVQLGQSMRFVGQQSIQLHGGIGVTMEYAAGHYFKRLTCMEMTFGDTMHHLGEVSARMQETAGVFA